MTESDGDIEYLEEDAEIVQQCVQTINTSLSSVATTGTPKSLVPPPLLVERPQVQKKRRAKEDDDSEYDPSEDVMPPSPPSPPVRKRKVPMKKARPVPVTSTVTTVLMKNINDRALLNRKKLNIHIPDFDDPLCLPVRAIKPEDDKKRLANWNNVCLEHFKHCDTLLKPERGNTKRSVRTAVFRNVVDKQTGNNETTIWSKTSVENENGDKKSEIFQCVLPQYKEKKVLGTYTLGQYRLRAATKTVAEVVLSMENHSDGRALVVYKPKESLSAVYGMIDKEDSPRPGTGRGAALRERCAARVCAGCYHGSHRGDHGTTKSLECPICGQPFSTVYNLLSHIKGHSTQDVHQHKKTISQVLADVVGYHYTCRICREQFESIKMLRQHLLVHQSKERFTCEVCNKTMNGRNMQVPLKIRS